MVDDPSDEVLERISQHTHAASSLMPAGITGCRHC
jgi:hypothetical protein